MKSAGQVSKYHSQPNRMIDMTDLTELERNELAILRRMETALRGQKDLLLTKLVPDNCGCNKGKPKRTWICKEAFEVHTAMAQLDHVRGKLGG